MGCSVWLVTESVLPQVSATRAKSKLRFKCKIVLGCIELGWVAPCIGLDHVAINEIFPDAYLSKQPYHTFLDASSHLYKRVCPSVRQSVRRSVDP